MTENLLPFPYFFFVFTKMLHKNVLKRKTSMHYFQTRNLCFFFLLFSNSFSIQIHPQHYRYNNFFFFISFFLLLLNNITTLIFQQLLHTIWTVRCKKKLFFLCKYFSNSRIHKIFIENHDENTEFQPNTCIVNL